VGRPDRGAEDRGAAELREAAGDRADRLAEVAGIAIGTGESKDPEYVAQGWAMAELCRMAGADEDLIPGSIEEGKRSSITVRLPGNAVLPC
jgi:hypothetical protein